LQLVALDDGELAATGGARGSMRLAIFSRPMLEIAAPERAAVIADTRELDIGERAPATR